MKKFLLGLAALSMTALLFSGCALKPAEEEATTEEATEEVAPAEATTEMPAEEAATEMPAEEAAQ